MSDNINPLPSSEETQDENIDEINIDIQNDDEDSKSDKKRSRFSKPNDNHNDDKFYKPITRMKVSISTPDFRQYEKMVTVAHAARSTNDPYEFISKIPSMSIYMARGLIKADIPLTKNYFPLCPHEHHCVQNALFKGFFRTFAAAFVFKTTIALVTNLFGGRIITRHGLNKAKLYEIYWSEDSMRFAQFIGLMSFTYKALLCLFRRYRKKDPRSHKLVAGFIAGLWILLDDPSRRKTLALYCLVRCIGDWLRVQVHRKKLPSIEHFDVASFTVAQFLIMYATLRAPNKMDDKYYKWVKNMGKFKEEVLQMAYRSPTGAMFRLPNEPFVPCVPIVHDHNSCLLHNMLDWPAGLLRAARIYFPVHFLPMLLLSPKIVFKDPMYFIIHKTLNALRSSVFLTTYQFNMKMVMCWVRNLVKDDPWWIGPLGGFFAGLSLLLEHPKRRGELALYCVPRALEILMRLIPRKFYYLYVFLRWRYLPVIAFALSIGLWMALIGTKGGAENSNGLNMTVLQIVFGTKH